MKHNNALLHGCLLAAGLTLLPFAAHATGLSNHFLAENSFTQSVKDGYQDIKKEVRKPSTSLPATTRPIPRNSRNAGTRI